MNKYLYWCKKHLFSSTFNTLLTFLAIYVIYTISAPILKWGIINADFIGSGPKSCSKQGACWIFVKDHLNQFIYGLYPRSEQWRIDLSFLILLISILIILKMHNKHKKWVVMFLLFVFPFISYYLYHGNIFGLKEVETYLWGGLHLTILIASTGIISSIPLGLFLALGRQSNLPVIRLICIIHIELWRTVPLISILFMSSVLIPLFLPNNLNIDKLLRAEIGITLFTSAYMAEIIRGGLQGVPLGQYEAARSLGIGYWHRMFLIILPQAIKIAIPNIVNTCIALFKDTTLVLIIGLFDFLAMIQAANADPLWLAYGVEAYMFAAFGFWIFCFAMSRYSVYLTKRLDSGRYR